MTNQLKLNEYKQGIADLYDQRSESYDDNIRLRQICQQLFDYAQISNGQTVLDIGTGTGHLAIAASKVVGKQGAVVAVDISPKMLMQARYKARTLNIENIEFQLLDAELLDYPVNHFDCILCANTFPWMENKQDTLSLWHSLLKSGGCIAVHTPGDTAYIGQVLLRKVFSNHGIILEASNRIGSREQCVNLFASAGFERIEIQTESYGNYTTLEREKAAWSRKIINSSSIYLKIHKQELSRLSSLELAQIKTEFQAELKALETELGIWNEVTTWYVLGHKP